MKPRSPGRAVDIQRPYLVSSEGFQYRSQLKILKADSSSEESCSDDGFDDGVEDGPFEAKATPPSPVSSKPSPGIPPCRAKHLPCPYADCDKSFNRPTRLEEHLRSHTNTRPYVCPHKPCTKAFLRSSHLKRHVQSAHSDVRDYRCHHAGCGKAYATGTRLRRHLEAHNVREAYRCKEPDCGLTFRKHSTLQSHQRTVHEGKPALSCSLVLDGKVCGQGASSAYQLKLHRERCHRAERFSCTVCKERDGEDGQEHDLTFTNYADFKTHNKTVHPPVCNECGRKCRSARELARHFEMLHGAQGLDERKIYVCSEPDCDKKYTTKSNLTAHVRQGHRTSRTVVCQDVDRSALRRIAGWDGSNACEKACRSKRALEEHIRTEHMGFPPRKARIQPVSTKSHSGKQTEPKTKAIGLLTGTAYAEGPERNISCLMPACDFKFIREYDLERHLQARHHLSSSDIESLQIDSQVPSGRNDLMDVCEDEESAPMHDWCEELESAAASGGPFWLGGSDEGTEDEWELDETEIERLIDVGLSENIAIDPALV